MYAEYKQSTRSYNRFIGATTENLVTNLNLHELDKPRNTNILNFGLVESFKFNSFDKNPGKHLWKSANYAQNTAYTQKVEDSQNPVVYNK